MAMEHPGCHIALVAPTTADVRDVMVRALVSPWDGGALAEIPTYEPSKRSLTLSNGGRATPYSADEPEQLRGPPRQQETGLPVLVGRQGQCHGGALELAAILARHDGKLLQPRGELRAQFRPVHQLGTGRGPIDQNVNHAAIVPRLP
jgi:hypothetical protein